MRTVVKTVVTAGVMSVGVMILAFRPEADAARSPYSVAAISQTDPLRLAIFNPLPSGEARLLPPLTAAMTIDHKPFELPWAKLTQPMDLPQAPVASLPPASFDLPQLPPATSEVLPPVVEVSPLPVIPEPAPTVADQPKVTPTESPTPDVPEIEPREAVIAPKLELPKVKRDGSVRRRQGIQAQVHANVMSIKFEGPAGAPFAHTRFCLKYPGECRVHKTVFRGGPIELTAARRQELIRINAEVNRSIVGTAMNEPVAQEQWVISPKFGDCNDYAVTKRHKLIAWGWPARALLLAEVVTTWGEHHLVLVVRTREGDVIADNLNGNIRNWTKAPYEWVRVESPVNPFFWSKVAAPLAARVASATDDRQL